MDEVVYRSQKPEGPKARYQVEDARWKSEVPVRDGDTAGRCPKQ